jgi:proteasome lid subunit RPN8/RPN11
VFAKPHSSARLRFGRRQWRGLIAELGKRGEGVRESGAFLLVDAEGGERVRALAYFDDLDPYCLTGGISLDGSAYGPLWQLCRERSLRVAADVHTHPTAEVRQSQTDRDNPMIAAVGHLGLIVPHLAGQPCRTEEVGVHEYRGDDGWLSALGPDAAALLYVGWRP